MYQKNSKMSLFLTTLVVFACSSQCIEALRILAIFPLHGKSHFVMCEQLAKGLAEKGHQVDVYSHFPQKKPVPNYTDYSLQGSMPAVMNNMTYEFLQQFRSVNMKAMMTVGNPICELLGLPVFQDLFKRLKENQPYDIVIVEVFISNCYLAWGRYLDIPMIGVITASSFEVVTEAIGNPINTAVVPSSFSNFLHPMTFWDRLSNTFMHKMIGFTYDYHIRYQDKYVEEYFGPGYPDVVELLKDLDLLLINSHYTIDGIRPNTPGVIPVGGLHVVDDGTKLPKEVQKWLDDSKDGCIYFSFGSMVRIETFPKPVLDAFYATFKNIAPVRVLFKIAKPEVLPPGLPSNVMTQSWFSQIQVLKHKNTKAFVTHGGLMSTQESIAAGVPVIGVPLFGDQYTNTRAQALKKAGVQVTLEELTEKSFTAAVKDVLNNPIYRNNAQALSKKFFDRPISPMDSAAFWVEYVARHGKNALRAPVIDLPWWQANLIDVYGFILLVAILILYVIKLILKKIMCLLCSSSCDKQSKQEKMKKKNK